METYVKPRGTPDLTERDWEDLLENIEEGLVIPIIGQDLISVKIDGEDRPFYPYVAKRLAERLHLPDDEGSAGRTLNDVVLEALAHDMHPLDIYPHIRRILNREFEPSPALCALAQIDHFDLFVSLTFDPLLANALSDGRRGAPPLQLAYSPKEVADLPAARAPGGAPVIYHLFGKSPGVDFALTEEDTLEFLYNMQSAQRRPHLLFDELNNNHLLIIGCGFADWLARFFLRITKNKNLSAARSEREIFIHGLSLPDRSLILFLRHFSRYTKLVTRSPAEFVLELAARWQQRQGRAGSEPANQGIEDMVPGSVFLSYAHEDYDAVAKIKESLELANIDVWIDKAEFEPGDAYEAMIRKNIRTCSLFLPIISRTSTTRPRGFFRAEWAWAERQAEEIAHDLPFILPVVIDDTPEYCDGVRESFRRVHWTRLENGSPTVAFQQAITKKLREARKSRGA